MHEYNAGCLGVERVCALCEIQTRWKPNSPPRPPCGPSCLPNQMISLILIFGFLCRSSSWWPWPSIDCGRLVWPLLRPQKAVFYIFFCKICFWWVWRRNAFFWVMSVTFLGPGRVFFWDLEWFPNKEGGFRKRRRDYIRYVIDHDKH